MFCSKCGCKLNNEALFCHNCGEKVSINKNLENSIEKESREIELNRTALKIYLYDILTLECIKNKYRIHNIIYQFSQQLKDIMGSKLTKVIVYGSYARGDYNSSSDVYVMILVKMSDNEIKKIENQVYDLAFDIEMDTGVDISPIIKNEEQYEYWLDTLPFYKNIHEEGVIVNG